MLIYTWTGECSSLSGNGLSCDVLDSFFSENFLVFLSSVWSKSISTSLLLASISCMFSVVSFVSSMFVYVYSKSGKNKTDLAFPASDPLSSMFSEVIEPLLWFDIFKDLQISEQDTTCVRSLWIHVKLHGISGQKSFTTDVNNTDKLSKEEVKGIYFGNIFYPR